MLKVLITQEKKKFGVKRDMNGRNNDTIQIEDILNNFEDNENNKVVNVGGNNVCGPNDDSKQVVGDSGNINFASNDENNQAFCDSKGAYCKKNGENNQFIGAFNNVVCNAEDQSSFAFNDFENDGLNAKHGNNKKSDNTGNSNIEYKKNDENNQGPNISGNNDYLVKNNKADKDSFINTFINYENKNEVQSSNNKNSEKEAGEGEDSGEKMITDFLERKKSRLLNHLVAEKNIKSLKMKAAETRKQNEFIFKQKALDDETLIRKKIINELIELEKGKMIGTFHEKKELTEIQEKLKFNANEINKMWYEKEKEMISLNEDFDEQDGGLINTFNEKAQFPKK